MPFKVFAFYKILEFIISKRLSVISRRDIIFPLTFHWLTTYIYGTTLESEQSANLSRCLTLMELLERGRGGGAW